MGPQVPHQGQDHLRQGLPRLVHEQQCVQRLTLVLELRTDGCYPLTVLIRPTAKELEEFGEPDFIVYNAGQFPANRFTAGMTSQTSVEINFKRKEMVILGTEYAGEMKKGIFSLMVSTSVSSPRESR
jgi:ATP-dependent phosphoenolpyruvate carboxykinase